MDIQQIPSGAEEARKMIDLYKAIKEEMKQDADKDKDKKKAKAFNTIEVMGLLLLLSPVVIWLELLLVHRVENMFK